MAELKNRPPRPSAGGIAARIDPEDIQILDDSPLTGQPYRLGDIFDLYHTGTGVKFKVTEIVERDGRRITYGAPA